MAIEKENIIVRMLFGSRLYGTDTKDSDIDYKGIFMPTKSEILLGNIPKSHNSTTKKGTAKNTPTDIDEELYSLHYFIELACQGQTVALDMLHANKESIITSSPVWENIVLERERFYTKNLKAFVGYARRQAAKYGIKGSRLNACRDVLDTLTKYEDEVRLEDIWDELPEGEHIHFLDILTPDGLRQYQVVGKKLQETVKVGHAFEILNKFYLEYGKRAQLAAENKGIDHKAISHAFRAALETKQLLTEGTITFPLKESSFLKKVKLGKLDYLSETLPTLEALMDEVENLSEKSTLPEKADRDFWDNWLITAIEEEIF